MVQPVRKSVWVVAFSVVACQPPPAMDTAVTWYRDVQPLTQEHCQSCHTAGGIGPFSMESYAQAKPMAAAMAADVASGKMPPWKPDPACGMQYLGDKRLSAEQVDVIERWSEQGALEGDAKDAPAPVSTSTGALQWVDQTVTPAQAYTPDMTLGPDDYHCSLIDPQLMSDRFVVGIQMLPGVRAEVHHVILYAVDRAKALAKDANGTGWTCFGGPGVDEDHAVFISGWAPGSGAVEFPSGTGINVPASDVFVMQVHYNFANGVDMPDQTQVQLQYANRTVTSAIVAPLVDQHFVVPPMTNGYTPANEPITFDNSFGVPVKIWGVFPHMHTHGSHIKVEGPNGCMVDIPQWDFHWQQQYFFRGAVTVNDGQSVSLTCTWNNTTTSELRWGEGTADEMCLAFLYLTL
jgi:mono/diheme cytochrome c family protein